MKRLVSNKAKHIHSRDYRLPFGYANQPLEIGEAIILAGLETLLTNEAFQNFQVLYQDEIAFDVSRGNVEYLEKLILECQPFAEKIPAVFNIMSAAILKLIESGNYASAVSEKTKQIISDWLIQKFKKPLTKKFKQAEIREYVAVVCDLVHSFFDVPLDYRWERVKKSKKTTIELIKESKRQGHFRHVFSERQLRYALEFEMKLNSCLDEEEKNGFAKEMQRMLFDTLLLSDSFHKKSIWFNKYQQEWVRQDWQCACANLYNGDYFHYSGFALTVVKRYSHLQPLTQKHHRT